MSNIFIQTRNNLQAIFYGLDWGWNPTHTESALRAVEGFLNAKTNYPKITAILEGDSELRKEFESKEFSGDMTTDWDLEKLKNEYEIGTLGYEYVVFMDNLGFEQLHFHLQSHVPSIIQNIFKLGVKNHDIVHLLFGLYDEKDGKLIIRDYHEWIFLFWTKAVINADTAIVDYLLFPTKIKAFFTFRLSEYNKAEKIGKRLAQNSKSLNQIWLKPYFGKPIEQVRKELGITTLKEVFLDSETSSE